MDVVGVGPVPHRQSDAIRLTGTPLTGGDPSYVERPIPIAVALRWIPAGQSGAVDPVHPIFVAGSALAAVQEKANAPADVTASFGFLVGDVYIAPETHLPYVVVDAAIHSGWSMPGDQLKSALLEARAIAEEDVKRDGGHIVGWYQTHAGADARLSVADVEAHLACFDQPWAVALVVAGRHGLAGGVFRVESRAARWNQFLPFYELLEGESLLPGGRKVTSLAWQNYCAPGLAFPEAHAARPSPPSGHVVLLDDGLDEAALEIEALRRVRPRRRSSVPARRLATVGGIGLLALGALFGAYRAVASGLPAGVPGPVPRPGLSAGVADALGDTVSFAVAAFGVRSNLFRGHKMTCQDLARGLIEVEGRWIAYISRDGVQSVTHQRLREQVNDVEHRYTLTRCPRP